MAAKTRRPKSASRGKKETTKKAAETKTAKKKATKATHEKKKVLDTPLLRTVFAWTGVTLGLLFLVASKTGSARARRSRF